MRRVSGAVWAAVLCLAVVATGCSRCSRKPAAKRELTDLEKTFIAAYTQGAISRESPIRVVFHEPVVAASALNMPVEPSPFRFSPGIPGVTVWSARHQIEFRPADRLPDGQVYAASLDLPALLPAKAKEGLSQLEFQFQAMKQSFEVTVDGLEAADAKDIKKQRLTGKLVTADVEDASRVEKVLLASHGKRAVGVEWAHLPDRRTHTFIVHPILRTVEPSPLRLSWDGSSLGVEKKDAQEITVPGLNTFGVDQARAVQAKEQYIELRFTDPLQPTQNLHGLVQVGDRDDLRFTISGSLVQVYSAKGWKGEQVVRVSPGVRNVLGYRLRDARELQVSFELLKPQVRFAGKGVIVPSSAGLTIPIETVNLRTVIVEAMKVPDETLPQFLQVNDLEGDRELNRVGRVVWKQAVPLDLTADKENRWVPVGLDLTGLVKNNPGGLYRLSLSFKRPHVVWTCENEAAEPETARASSADGEQEASNWDSAEEYLWYGDAYRHRDDPCHPAYYHKYYDHTVEVARNVLVSDLGVVAKAGEDDAVLVIVTDLRTTEPVAGADVTITDYQQQSLATGRTDRRGMVRLAVERKPYLVAVRKAGQTGYLRMDDGAALSMAHFDVAGAQAPKGLKGFLYGERGVWRPGDTLHLTFVLFDPAKRLPGSHPARFELVNPRNQIVKTLTRTAASDGFYSFAVATSPDAPTGNYTARVTVGGATFDRVLKVETIMPNRLKIALDFGSALLRAGQQVNGVLSSTWLHGAIAKNLKADVELALSPAATRFERYAEYVFDDPTRKYETERRTLFEGQLDEKGTARIDAAIAAENLAPGRLTAHFTTRVFEPGGSFSIDRFTVPYSPYQRYIGIRAPKGDKARGMILTDVKHALDLVAVDPDGKPAGDLEVEVKLYKIGWRWWWERGEEDLSAYAESWHHSPLQQGVVRLKNGVGSWPFEIKYPDWGRYLITAADRQGGHRTGRVVYVDWPGWAGRGQKEMAGGASVLGFAADKQEYAVGETVTLTIPTPQKGRGLVSIESGSRLLKAEWIDATGAETRFTFTAQPEMAPNVYAHVTLLQPHAQTGNDLPIRLYGVALVKVVDPATRLKPVVESPEVLVPDATATVAVREASGRSMTYTLAVVDEGLLSLTRFTTPNPWDHFYAREALAVKTWDVYDHVLGAYGAALERMLAIGGGDEGVQAQAKRANRFPPMVRFLGPFRLERGATGTHQVDIPQYVGAVRLMVVAGGGGAFGAAEKSVFVRKPLMILGTLPRVVGPEETVSLPVSVFALEKHVKDVAVTVSASGPLELVGPPTRSLRFKSTGDDVVSFALRTKPVLGVGKVLIRAASGTTERAEQAIELDVRMSAVRTVDVLGATLKPGEAWEPAVPLPGVAGTNEVTLEVSRIPPLDLGRRLEYLIRYPHGCIEQTVSSVFPQLYLPQLLELTAERRSRIEANVKAGLERLRSFQTSEGGFGYWPGDGDPADWVSNYAGHFAVEAQKAGYLTPPGLIDQWKSFQRRRARAWTPGTGQADLTQAYRLYTLALAGAAELGAMNQLRERGELPVAARWRLAAAYQLAGQPEAARALVTRGSTTVVPYRELAGTYGSDLRDKAMILEALAVLDRSDLVGPLAREVSETLSKNEWLSTHETAYALLALARCAGPSPADARVSFSYAWNGGKAVTVTSTTPIVQRSLAAGAKTSGSLAVRNTGTLVLYPRLVVSGLPPVGRETSASNGLALEVEYTTPEGTALDPQALEQGTDFKARVKVTNTGVRGNLEEIALSQVFPSGWEIHNERMDLVRGRAGTAVDYQDVRDDRVYSYFDLKAGETKTFEVVLNAAYLGRFYRPLVSAEAMYDETINARVKGQWVRVVEPGIE
jgi:hypothetical protein